MRFVLIADSHDLLALAAGCYCALNALPPGAESDRHRPFAKTKRLRTEQRPVQSSSSLPSPEEQSRIFPLARYLYFNNGSFPFQHSEHKRNESKFGSLTQAFSRETPLVQMSTLSSVLGSKPGRWELRAHISSADVLLWFVQLCTKKVCGDVYQ